MIGNLIGLVIAVALVIYTGLMGYAIWKDEE